MIIKALKSQMQSKNPNWNFKTFIELLKGPKDEADRWCNVCLEWCGDDEEGWTTCQCV
jgi:hypothetical protein